MADYWKSQAKKFCDFCKCWIADNKPSIGFHESGKRHKENVAKRLSEISKNSTKSYKEELQVDKEMKKMEQEAFKAYMKDLQENPDYTSKKILEETERRKRELEESFKEQNNQKEVESTKQEEQHKEDVIPAEKLWYEAKSEEGYIYYWNVKTTESKWEPPEEGYVSLSDQENVQKELKLKEEMKRRKKEEKVKLKNEGSSVSERREKKKRKKQQEKSEEVQSIVAGPAPKPDPYGAWTTVEPKIEEPLDLQLPEQEYIAIKVPELIEPEIKFKEKTISSLGEDEHVFSSLKKENDESSSSFKKRKLNRGNLRQKLDTD